MGDSAPAAAALLFTGPDQSGQARALGTALDGRYDRYPASDMTQDYLYRKFRSGTVYKPADGATTMILFGHETTAGTHYAWEWQGAHAVLTNNTGSEWDLNFAEIDFDQRTESVLVVHTQRAAETRLFWSQAAGPLVNQMSANLPDQIELDGGPRLGWHAFTAKAALSGGGALSAKRIYLTITQDITVVMPWWWANYSAMVKFWIRLRVNSDGVAEGWVQRSEYWIESGAFSEVVEAILSPNLQLLVPQINNAITAALAPINAPGTLTDIYFLPGQTLRVNTGIASASTRNALTDVTIVFEGV
jgi:hypothetical protein